MESNTEVGVMVTWPKGELAKVLHDSREGCFVQIPLQAGLQPCRLPDQLFQQVLDLHLKLRKRKLYIIHLLHHQLVETYLRALEGEAEKIGDNGPRESPFTFSGNSLSTSFLLHS